MSDISQSFVKQFEKDVHLAYQQIGSKLKNTVRFKNNIQGASTTFQKVGKGVATVKSRHGLVPVMNLDHTPIECSLQDFYAGDWVDALDELKINHDERRVVASAGAYALGRKTDDLIIEALSGATNAVGVYTAALTKDVLLTAFAALNNKDVPDDGNRYGIVGPLQWNALLNIDEFSSSDYAGDNLPFLKGTEARKWLGINWIMHTGLPLDGTERDCFIFHQSAVGHASGCDVKTDISWHGDHASNFVNNMLSQGSCLIDEDGVIKIKCKEA
ncbi:MAG: phage capsid protein [Alphaproteobacteria bacterium]